MTTARTKALRKYQEAARQFENHIYTKRGTLRAVLSHERPYYETKREELRIKMRAAYKAYKSHCK